MILVNLYLEQVKHVSSIQTVVAQPMQQFHLSARREVLKRTLSKWVGLPFFQFPAVADDVIEITTKRLGPRWQSKRTEETREDECVIQ